MRSGHSRARRKAVAVVIDPPEARRGEESAERWKTSSSCIFMRTDIKDSLDDLKKVEKALSR